MTRRSRSRKPPARAYTARAAYPTTPIAAPPSRSFSTPRWAALYPYRSRVPPLAPTVTVSRTVRPFLMRTVRTDTAFRFRPPNRRPSPNLANRSIDRVRSWTTYLKNPSNALQDIAFDHIAPYRAVVCAKRAIRREVLLALNLGSGAGSRGKPRSKVRC